MTGASASLAQDSAPPVQKVTAATPAPKLIVMIAVDQFSAEPGRGGFIADWIAVLDEAAETVRAAHPDIDNREAGRSEEHTSELQSLMRISYAVFCLKKKPT